MACEETEKLAHGVLRFVDQLRASRSLAEDNRLLRRLEAYATGFVPVGNPFSVESKKSACPDCHGEGAHITNPLWPEGTEPHRATCNTCGGTGEDPSA